MLRVLSKRVKRLTDSKIQDIEKMVKQLKFNDVLHPAHSDKIDKSSQDAVAERACGYAKKMENSVSRLNEENRELRKTLKENLENKKEFEYYLQKLKEACDLFRGKHPLNEDLRQIHKENSEY